MTRATLYTLLCTAVGLGSLLGSGPTTVAADRAAVPCAASQPSTPGAALGSLELHWGRLQVGQLLGEEGLWKRVRVSLALEGSPTRLLHELRWPIDPRHAAAEPSPLELALPVGSYIVSCLDRVSGRSFRQRVVVVGAVVVQAWEGVPPTPPSVSCRCRPVQDDAVSLSM